MSAHRRAADAAHRSAPASPHHPEAVHHHPQAVRPAPINLISWLKSGSDRATSPTIDLYTQTLVRQLRFAAIHGAIQTDVSWAGGDRG